MRINLILFFIAISITLGAQKKYKFKKVTKQMLEQSEHPLEPETEAAFLYNGYDGSFDYRENNGGFIYEFTVNKRIKVYTENGKKWGDFMIYLYNENSEREEIVDIDAYTFNLRNGKNESVKLKKSDIYEEEINEYWSSVKFALPDVQEGSIMDVKYTIKSPFTYRISEFYLQKYIPVDYGYYEIAIPEYYGYSPHIKGLVALESETSQRMDAINYTYREDNGLTGPRGSKQTGRIDYQLNVSKFFSENIPALNKEDYVHNMDNYRTSIAYELMFTKFPGSAMKTYSNSWDKVADMLDQSSKFGRALDVFKKEAKELATEVADKSPIEKVQHIYTYANQNFTWNNEKRLLSSGPRNFLKNKKGNSADINLFLAAALSEAGIEAYPVVSKTRSEGYLNVAFPAIADLNYVLVKAKAGEQTYFLDATTKGMPMGYIPERADNLFGVLINGKQGSKIDIQTPNDKARVTLVKLQLNEEGLKGERQTKYSKLSNYYARSYYLSDKSEEDILKTLNAGNSDAVVSSIEFENDEDMHKDLLCVQEIDYSSYLQEVDSKLFIPSLLDLGSTENPFQEEERKMGVFFDNKLTERVIVQVALPDGYEIESLPESKSFGLPDKAMQFSYVCNRLQNGYSISTTLKRNSTTMTPEAYLALKNFYDLILDLTNKSVVIAKHQ